MPNKSLLSLKKSTYFTAITFLVLIPLHAYTSKNQKHLLFPVKLANQYLYLLMGSTTFSIFKGTTIDLLHLGVIKILFWRRCRGAQHYW
jgi:hypothetical protein